MVLVLAETEKFQRPFATASIERMIIVARTFVNEPKLRQKFCRRTFPPFPCLSPANRCDQSNAFHFLILNRVAEHSIACDPEGAAACYRLTGKYRLLAAANFEFVAIGVFEKEGVVTRAVVLANFRPFKVFPASVAHEFRNPIHFLARVGPERDACAVWFMFFIPSKAKEFRRFVAASRIERYGIARAFRERIQAVAKISHKTFSPFPCLSPANRCDRSNAFSFCDSQSHRCNSIGRDREGRARSPLRADRNPRARVTRPTSANRQS